jgi:hypothetical protein
MERAQERLRVRESQGRSRFDPSVELDFDKVMVIAVFGGNTIGGRYLDAMTESDQLIRLRLHDWGPQRDANDHTALPHSWAVYVIPRSNKEVVLEKDVESNKNVPRKWKEWKTFPAITAK